MRLKLDENLGEVGRAVLEADGHDVMTVRDQGLVGATDTQLCEVCKEEQRVLVTLERDFAQTLRFRPGEAAGIVVLVCGRRQSMVGILERIDDLIHLLREQDIAGALRIVEPGRVRIHDPR